MVPLGRRAATPGTSPTPPKRLSAVAHDVEAQDEGGLLVTVKRRGCGD